MSAAGRDVLLAICKRSLPDIFDARNRWVPKSDLLQELDYQVIHRILRLFPEQDYVNTSVDEIANYVSPRPGRCCICGDDLCSGARHIFVGLIEISREAEIRTFYQLGVCDSRPGLAVFAQSQAQDVHKHTEPDSKKFGGGSGVRDGSELVSACVEHWELWEKEYFCHCQWWLKSPFLKGKEPENIDTLALDDRLSLPWIAAEPEGKATKEQDGDKLSTILGQFSTITKVKIHPDHHDMVRVVCARIVSSKTLNWGV